MAKFVGEQALTKLVSKTKTKLQEKQDKLVSGTNLKTLNGNSLLGSGNLDLQLESGGTSVTLNGVSKAGKSASFYAPTSAISVATSKRYLIGSESTTSVATENTNEGCYMQNGKLYSNSALVTTTTVTSNPAGASLSSGTLSASKLITTTCESGTIYEWCARITANVSTYTQITITLPTVLQGIATSNRICTSTTTGHYKNWERVGSYGIAQSSTTQMTLTICDDSAGAKYFDFVLKAFKD